MHEFTLIEKVFNRAAEEARKRNFSRVREITLQVGKMNGLTHRHFTTALDARTDDYFADTNLAINEIPVQLVCSHCGNPFIDTRFDNEHFAHATSHAPELYLPPPCPECRGQGARMINGTEFVLASLDGV